MDMEDNMITINQDKVRENRLIAIRTRRNSLLVESDKYLLSDFPISNENIALVKKYREDLRGMTESVNIYDPQYPILVFV